ncbi:MAG: helix-turn-helix transcriptional regulator, partial [Clostridia bacterium]|nr:helix-turn-helix transcriptional regulator [Clostridia bacterium]
MKNQKWYNEDDLKIYIYYNDEPKDVKTKNYLDKIYFDSGTYKLIYVISGDRIFEIGKKRIKATNGTLAIAPPNTRIGFERTSNRTNCYIEVNLHQRIFDSVIGDNEFLRVFHDTSDEEKVFDVFKLNTSIVLELLDSIYQALDKHLGRVHILPKILSIISELDIEFDNKEKTSFKGSTNHSVKLMRYIENNYAKKIALDEVCERFFVSKPTVNSIVQTNTGRTFLQHVNYLRVLEAERLIKGTQTPLNRIYSLVGFSDYSTFYREYKKFFGISP